MGALVLVNTVAQIVLLGVQAMTPEQRAKEMTRALEHLADIRKFAETFRHTDDPPLPAIPAILKEPHAV